MNNTLNAGDPAPSFPPPRDKRRAVGDEGVALTGLVAGVSFFGFDAILLRA